MVFWFGKTACSRRNPELLVQASRRRHQNRPKIVGLKGCGANKYATPKIRFIPVNQAVSRMDAMFAGGIVIPVVVGSSPISHPK
jgi:hypothetical protein